MSAAPDTATSCQYYCASKWKNIYFYTTIVSYILMGFTYKFG